MFLPFRLRGVRLGWAFLSAGLVFAAGVPGCGRSKNTAGLPAERSVTGYAWDGMYSSQVFHVPFDRALKESLAALRALGFTPDMSASKRERNHATLIGYNPAKVSAECQLQGRLRSRVEIKVKVTSVGDRSSSERILDQIQKGLSFR